MGNYAADPDLWGFCGTRTRSSPGSQIARDTRATPTARRAGQNLIGASFSASASSCRVIMLPRTTGTRVVLPQPGHRTAAPAHPGEAPTTDPADAGQHPEHPPPTRASLQQRVTTPEMPRTDRTRRTTRSACQPWRASCRGRPDFPVRRVTRLVASAEGFSSADPDSVLREPSLCMGK